MNLCINSFDKGYLKSAVSIKEMRMAVRVVEVPFHLNLCKQSLVTDSLPFTRKIGWCAQNVHPSNFPTTLEEA